MKVLIVAKTHLFNALCVGGLARDTNANIRLMQPDGHYQPVDTQYEVGDVWDIEFSPQTNVVPPHVEDVIVQHSQRLGRVGNIKETLIKRITPWYGEPTNLFDGLIRFTKHGTGYIAKQTGVPHKSVGFWITNQLLIREDYQNKIRYYTTDYRLRVTYVGVAEAIETIPPQTLVRVSLARWWQPIDGDLEMRCYLQLSGWYL